MYNLFVINSCIFIRTNSCVYTNRVKEFLIILKYVLFGWKLCSHVSARTLTIAFKVSPKFKVVTHAPRTSSRATAPLCRACDVISLCSVR